MIFDHFPSGSDHLIPTPDSSRSKHAFNRSIEKVIKKNWKQPCLPTGNGFRAPAAQPLALLSCKSLGPQSVSLTSDLSLSQTELDIKQNASVLQSKACCIGEMTVSYCSDYLNKVHTKPFTYQHSSVRDEATSLQCN